MEQLAPVAAGLALVALFIIRGLRIQIKDLDQRLAELEGQVGNRSEGNLN